MGVPRERGEGGGKFCCFLVFFFVDQKRSRAVSARAREREREKERKQEQEGAFLFQVSRKGQKRESKRERERFFFRSRGVSSFFFTSFGFFFARPKARNGRTKGLSIEQE